MTARNSSTGISLLHDVCSFDQMIYRVQLPLSIFYLFLFYSVNKRLVSSAADEADVCLQGHGVLEMPSGTGKTISLLSLIVAYQRVSCCPRRSGGLSMFERVVLFSSGLSAGRDQADLLLQNSS